MGFEKPTEVQEKSIPDILAGRDVMHWGPGWTGALTVSENAQVFDQVLDGLSHLLHRG